MRALILLTTISLCSTALAAPANQVGNVVIVPTAQGIRRFVLQRYLGHGASSDSWQGVDTATGQEVAVKMQHDTAIARGARDSFNLEHRIMNEFSAPQLLRSIGVGVTVGPTPKRVLVQELAVGQQLDIQRTWARDAAVRVVMQVLLGLRAMHQAGRRHNDLKPENIILKGDDAKTVKLIDLAGASPLNAQLTGWHSPYMAPEQFHWQHSGNRTNADLYSAAAMLYVLVTGDRPTRQDGYEFAKRAYTRLTTASSAGLEAVIARGLDPNPARRYQHVDQMLAALAPFASPAASTSNTPSVAPAVATP